MSIFTQLNNYRGTEHTHVPRRPCLSVIVDNHLLLLASKAEDVVTGVVGHLAVVLHLDELAGAHHGEVGEDGHVREVAVLQVGELTVLQDGDRWGGWKGLEGECVIK